MLTKYCIRYYVRINPDKIIPGLLVEIQATFGVVCDQTRINPYEAYQMVLKLRSICVIDRIVELVIKYFWDWCMVMPLTMFCLGCFKCQSS